MFRNVNKMHYHEHEKRPYKSTIRNYPNSGTTAPAPGACGVTHPGSVWPWAPVQHPEPLQQSWGLGLHATRTPACLLPPALTCVAREGDGKLAWVFVAQAVIWTVSSELASPFLALRKLPSAGSRWPRRDLAVCARAGSLESRSLHWVGRQQRVLGRWPSRISFTESCRLLEVRAPQSSSPPGPTSSCQLRVAAPAADWSETTQQRSPCDLVRSHSGQAVLSLSALP